MKEKNKPLLVEVAEWLTNYDDGSAEHRRRMNELLHAAQEIEKQRDKLCQELKEARHLCDQLKLKIKKLYQEKIESEEVIKTLKEKCAEYEQIVAQVKDKLSVCKSKLQTMEAHEESCIQQYISMFRNAELMRVSDVYDKQSVVDFYAAQCENVLVSLGVVKVNDTVGVVNPAVHKIVSVQQTDNSEKIGTIAYSVQCGFKRGEQCIVEQEVCVFID